ncbi:hypothetical protein QR680_004268 [Steinernema hermaphroditum]|uniref:Nephrocystin-4 n=1 Tax=Steinernema hermaphroditum TaxID=289476 RepID=A0AA39LSX5_9BILA|nr:hypothetical protein QR680_004268 [Steinernema hermaphroditum]
MPGKILYDRCEFFFHMALRDEGVHIVVEIVEVQPSEDYDNPELITLAWTICPVYNIGQIMTDYNPSGIFNQPSKRIHLFEGSPQVLLTHIGGPLESCDGLYKHGVSRILECYLQTHERMTSVLDFTPEFVFMTRYDDIPGFENDSDLSQLVRPIVAQKSTIMLDQIAISFGERAEQIEKAILDLTTQDWVFNLNQTMEQFLKTKKMEIIERRLKVGIHNGYTYVDEPYCMSMIPKDELLSKSHSLRRRLGTGWVSEESIKSEMDTFMVRNTVKLDRIFNHKAAAVVFAVYYVIGIRNPDMTVEMSKTEMICWGAWCPNDISDVAEITVPLIGGPNPNPDHHLCFKNLLRIREHENEDFMANDGRPRIELSFQCTPVKPSTRSGSFTMADRTSAHMPPQSVEDELLKIPSPEPEPVPASPPVGATIDTRDFLSEEIEEDFSKPRKPVETPKSGGLVKVDSFSEMTTRVLAISRQCFVLVQQFKFHEITDRNGNMPALIEVDDSRGLNIQEELNDRLSVNEVFIQFLGVKGRVKTRKYFFVMKFYRFEQIVTERLQAIMADDDVSIFQRIDENGSVINPKQCGFLVKFVVDKNAGKSGDEDEYVQYLARNNLTIDVFDADSLMHLGKVVVPLKIVLRQTHEAVHSYLQVPIACSSMPQKGYTFNGSLLLHMGNIGHGSARSLANDKRPNPLIIRKSLRTVYNPHIAASTRIRAKSMGVINDSALQKFITAQKVETSTSHDISAMERIEQWNKLREINHPSFTKKTLKRFIFQEELEAYKQLRNENKASKLLKVVFQGITTEHAIYPSLGQMEFFEFQLQNTNSIAVKCRPSITDSRLRLVTDREEWLYLRKVNNISTTIDRDIYDNSRTHILLKPMETVYVPFKYEHTYNTIDDDIDLTPFSVKTVFQRSGGEPISILDLNVNPRGFVVDQSYRFFHDSEVKFQKVMKITSIPNNRHVLKLRSSDPTVLLKLRHGNDGSQHVVLNTHSIASPGVKTFLVMFYGDQFHFRLLSTWQLSVHSCNRISVQTIQGQATKIPLPIKLESVPDPFVQIFGSHPSLRIDPPNAVLGSSFKEGDPPVSIFTPDKRIDQVLMVTAVDQSLRQLLSAWLIYTNVKEANITKSYNVNLPIGGTKVITRKIALENQYNIQQKFRVHSSDENLVILSQEYYDVPPNQAASVVLCFQPVIETPGKKEVLLFVENAETLQQEEAYLLSISYEYP